MSKKPQNKNGIWKKHFLKSEEIEFKDNQQRFRRFGKLKKDMLRLSFSIVSVIGIIISIIPLAWHKHNTTIGWALWITGLCTSLIFEQLANFHYYKYSKLANEKNVNNVKLNILINKVLRMVAAFGWLISFFALAILSVSSDGSFSSIW